MFICFNMDSQSFFKFNSLNEAQNVVNQINVGEGIPVNVQSITTTYCDIIERDGKYYILKDEITSKYTNVESVELLPIPFIR